MYPTKSLTYRSLQSIAAMLEMSDSRIRPTLNWFEAKGLHQNYQTEGLGAANPVAPNANDDGSDNPEGRAKNRRVEIIVNKTKKLGE